MIGRYAPHDYRRPGAYFITAVTHQRRPLFGRVRDGRMERNRFGDLVVEEWHRTGALRDHVVLDAFVCMPDHIHGILCIVPPGTEAVSARGYRMAVSTTANARRTLRWDAPRCPAQSLGTIVGRFKGAVTRRINQHRGTPGGRVWQSTFHDWILRTESQWRATRRYIQQNPAAWEAKYNR